jgi:hypothetical protein
MRSGTDIVHFSEKACRLRPFENEKARNEDRAWLRAGSSEAIEKFLAEYYYYCF